MGTTCGLKHPRSISKDICLEGRTLAAHTTRSSTWRTPDSPACRASGDGTEQAACQDTK